MRTLIQAKSTFLLLVFISYTMLSCLPSNDVGDRTKTIERIQDRLNSKDYIKPGLYKNQHQDITKEVANVMNFLHGQGIIKDRIPKAIRVAFESKPSPFRFASVNETLTLGVDDPSTFDQMVVTATNYYGGAYTYEEVRASFTSLNSVLLNYPMTYSGGSQFLNDRVADGTISSQQRDVLEAEINALLNATSEAEVLNIINTVNYEVSNSQFSSHEIDQITSINAGVEGMTELVAIAMTQSDENSYLFHKTGGAGIIAGLALIAIGYILYSVGDYGIGETIGYIGAAIFTIAFIDGWGQQ